MAAGSEPGHRTASGAARRNRLLALFLSLATAACSEDPRLDPQHKGPRAQHATRAHNHSVDGLTVGHRLMDAGEHELALNAYLRAGAEQGLNADVLSALGSANLQLGRLGQAERLLRRAVETDETYAAAWNNLGVVLMEQQQVGEAARVFRIAFALDRGQSSEIRNNLTNALARMKNPAGTTENKTRYELVRDGSGTYRLRGAP
ncbi:tetratricopeptide repeat protein [Tropicimonas sp.]|uniref:tetratricopeptide repeat protein n=1 Tax=Tropicimonas sp. TaxID=2067044 RepID=UPI003A876662